ncbi:MAG: hypothetical protein IJU78_04520 [Clostridia bacterium]|nr:hypothetical protein [Clostridia bacterium]
MKNRTVLNASALLLAVALALPSALIRRALSKGSALLEQPAGDFIPLYIAVGVAVLLLCAVSALILRREQTLPEEAEEAPLPGWYKAARALAALAFLAAAYFTLTGTTDVSRAVMLVQTVFLAVCGAAVLGAAGGRSAEQTRFAGLFPLYYICFFLLIFYRGNANNPTLHSFALEIITLLSVMLATYLTVGMRFERHKPFVRVFFVLLSLYFAAFELLSFALVHDSLVVIPSVSAGMMLTLAALFMLLAADFVRVPRTPAAESAAEEESAAEDGETEGDA